MIKCNILVGGVNRGIFGTGYQLYCYYMISLVLFVNK